MWIQSIGKEDIGSEAGEGRIGVGWVVVAYQAESWLGAKTIQRVWVWCIFQSEEVDEGRRWKRDGGSLIAELPKYTM
jgi:hypothetical protein